VASDAGRSEHREHIIIAKQLVGDDLHMHPFGSGPATTQNAKHKLINNGPFGPRSTNVSAYKGGLYRNIQTQTVRRDLGPFPSICGPYHGSVFLNEVIGIFQMKTFPVEFPIRNRSAA
jgi:hypothetical protein